MLAVARVRSAPPSKPPASVRLRPRLPEPEEDWTPPVPRARRAFLDYMPIRFNADDPERVYRAFGYGPLLDIFMLDERSEPAEVVVLESRGRDFLAHASA